MTNRTYRLGEIEVTALVDAVPAPVDITWSYPDIPRSEWANCNDGSLDAHGRFQPNLGCFLVELGGRKLLVDAGIGPGPNAYLGGLEGHMPKRLAEAGISFDDIDAAIFTHLHMDHIGWASTAAGPTMAKIPHYVSAAELDYWAGAPADAGAHHIEAFDAAFRPLMAAGLAEAVEGGREILPGIEMVPTPGHTPGHCSVLFSAGADVLVIAGDVCHCPAQIAYPERCHRADRDPATAEASRRRFISRAADENWIVAAGHFRDDVTFGRIERDADGGFVHMPLVSDA